MGVRSVRTMELSDIQRYVSCLIVLAAFSIALRLAWVLDVILQVQQLVTESHKQAAGSGNGNSGSGEDQGGSDEGDGGDGGGDNDDKDGNGSSNEDVFYFDNDTHGGNNDGDEPHPLDSSLVLTFGIQVRMMNFLQSTIQPLSLLVPPIFLRVWDILGGDHSIYMYIRMAELCSAR